MFTSPIKDDGSRPGTKGRLRTDVACEIYRIRKTKCNSKQPCIHCWQHDMICIYREGPARTSRRKNPVTPSHEVGRSIKVLKELKKTSTPPGFGYDPAQIKKQIDLRAGISVSNSRTGSFQFYSPSSHFNFIQHIYQRIYRTSHETPSDRQRHPIPAGLQRWCLEPFIFSLKLNANNPHISARETFINKERGDAFLDSYFRIIHPLMPILSRSDIIHN
ncbi:hypothetical protein N7465_009082 [Penicillium sp. CMV-2018d]|nr:hypothetical protein N7465_009082 [Penicillium sp. CMV-2018d]